MDKVTDAIRACSFNTLTGLSRTFSGADSVTQKAMSKLYRNRDTNQEISWPGRLDPCNRSHGLSKLLQQLLDEIVSGNLNADQRMLARHDLQMIAVRCFCQNRVGWCHELAVTLQGEPLRLDAVHLAQLLQDSPDVLPAPDAFHKIVQRNSNNPRPPKPITLSNPEQPLAVQLNSPNFIPKPNFRGPLYAEMKREIAKVPLPKFDDIQKNQAKQVIDLLPPANQGKLRGIPAQLIGVDAYCEVLRAAAHEKKLPEPLMGFRESCENDIALKRAIYTNPYIAARILGLSLIVTPSNREAASLIAQPIVESFIPKSRSIKSSIHFAQMITHWGQSETMRLISQVFKKLDEFSGFNNQEMSDVPSCFPDIRCPESSGVHLSCGNFPAPKIHANYVSMGHCRQAIAAMQPVYSNESKSSNLAGFYQLLANTTKTNGTQVIDLRSNADFINGSYDYCPPLGKSRLIQIPESKQTIRIRSLKEHALDKANCKAITVSIQIGNLEPKEIKVIQFRHWPDHGVVTPDELRALREVAAKPLNQDQCLVTHSRAGVGRTGTLLAYEHLHHDLIVHGNGKFMIDADGKVNQEKLLLAVTRVVAQGRIERGPYFVQKDDQFKLLYKTLKADLLTSQDKPSPKVKLQKPPVVITGKASLPGQTIRLDKNPITNFLAEPANLDNSLKTWDSILQNGEDVIEMISTPSRLVNAKEAASSGLGVVFNELIRAKKKTGNSPGIQLGNNRLLEIKPIEAKKAYKEGQLMHSQKFVIRYQSEDDSTVKSICYTQFLAPFDGKKLTARQLNEIVVELNTNPTPPKLLCSAKGVGRPSALLLAQAMQVKIREGAINNDKQLIDQIDEWAAVGRAKFGPLFINSRQQREQLIILGQSWLANKNAGVKMTAKVAVSNEDVQRSNNLKVYMTAFEKEFL